MRRDVFQAIADPTRRQIINMISRQSLNLNAVAEKFDVSRPAISRHIKILTECGLVVMKKQGRERYCEAKLDKLNDVSDWVEQYRKFWTARLDSLLTHEDLFDFVNIDIQGAELQALVGMGDLLVQCRWLYLEVNKTQVYKDCAMVGDIDKYLETQGFRRVHTLWVRGAGWGDALYARRTIYSQTVSQRIRVNLLMSKTKSRS